MVSLGIDEVYAVERMRVLVLHPEFPGDAYEWTLRSYPHPELVSGSPSQDHLSPHAEHAQHPPHDSVLSRERDLVFCAADTGTYLMHLHIYDNDNPVDHNFKIVVWEEQVAYSPYITDVYEYCPAPGQFINELPPYEAGDTYRNMLIKVRDCISGTNQVLISLGAWGGYVTFGFDHSVVNIHDEMDFAIFGNAFYAESKKEARVGGSCEPGIVMVSVDVNGNGLPDDAWYELQGSAHHHDRTINKYQCTYFRTPKDHQPTPRPASPIADTTYISWTDNEGNQGYVEKNVYHKQDYFPQWLNDDAISFSGTCLPPNAIDESGNGTYYVLYAYDYGYVDNAPNDSLRLCSFNLDWAVDSLGRQVSLPCADFIRVYTGVQQSCGWIGETSTELSQAIDLHIIQN